MPKSGKAHENRKSRAQAARDSDKAGRDARKALSAPYTGKGISPFGERNRLLIKARAASRVGDQTTATDCTAKAAAIAPLTGKEAKNIAQAHFHTGKK